ncbi:MAG: L-rhamnose mutarotase [Planctomycetota bacterium]
MSDPRPAAGGQRIGLVVGLRPEMEERYRALHADPWRGVLERITRSGIRDYTIYLARLPDGLYLFSHFVYVGDDLDADLAAIGADEETRRWWKETDPCQIRLPGTSEGEQWLAAEEVFHHD